MAGGQLPSSLRAPTISPTSPRHRGLTTKPLVAGKGLLFPTTKLPARRALLPSTADIPPRSRGDTDLGLLLLPPPKSASPPPITASNTSLLSPSTFSTSNHQTLTSAPGHTRRPAHNTRSPRASTESHQHPPLAPTPGTGSLPQPGRGSPVASPFAQPLSSHRSKTAGSTPDVTHTQCWPTSYPA